MFSSEIHKMEFDGISRVITVVQPDEKISPHVVLYITENLSLDI